MVVDTKKENLCINQIVGKKETVVDVEGDIIIPDIKPDILNAVNTSGNVCIYKKDILDGKVRLDGSINIYVMYVPDGEADSVRGINTSLDFTEVMDIDEARAGMSSEEEITLNSIECKVLNGRKINLKATLEIRARIFSNENVSMIRQIDNIQDIQTLTKTTQINSLVGEGCNKIYAKDTIQIDEIDNLAEILKTDIEIKNRDIKVSYNKILAKADLEVKILYLTEDNRINKANSLIPIMGFVDIPNVTDDNVCDTSYQIKNMLIKPNTAEEHSIYVEVQIELQCSAYEIKEINMIQDLYSPRENINFTKETINAMSDKQIKKDVCVINEQIQIPEIGNNRIYDVDVRNCILSQNVLNDKIVYEGELELSFLYEAENMTKIDVRKMKLPFNFSMEARGVSAKNRVETRVEIKQNDFIVQGSGNIDCKIQLEMQASISHTREINVIKEINVEDDIPCPSYSMVIYFVRSGDSIWKIAKKFKSTVADIVKVNEIEDENKIYPGMQLFIPKYNCRKLA